MATQTAAVSKERLLDWYYQIVLIREFETRCDELYKAKKITGVYMHLYSGHEAVGVGALATLGKNDHVITAYRDHGIALARGVDPKPLMAEMMGKRTGVSGGKGGSMHLASALHNFWGGYAIVAGHLPLAAGIALKEKYNETNNAVLCFMGDGSTNNGYFHESLNIAAVWDLPIVWLIENNLYGMGTSVERASGQTHLAKRAIAYGMDEMPRVDGQDVVAVYSAVQEAIDIARKGRPVLLEVMSYRYKGHGVSDKAYGEREEELRQWNEKDPITVCRRYLLEMDDKIEPELRKLEQQAYQTVQEAVQFADESPEPTYEDLINNIYVK